MKFIPILLFFSYCFLHSLILCGQEPIKNIEWSLKQCIDYALEHNLRVKQSGLNVRFSEETLIQSKAQVLPNLNGFATHSYNFGQTIDPYTNLFANDRVQSNNFALSSSLTLFNGLQTYHTIQQNQFNMMAGKSDEEKMKNDISLSIATAYLQVLFSEELVLTGKNQTNITRLQLERMQKMVEAGVLPRAKLLELEAQMALEELNVVNAENQKDLSYLNLKQLLDLDMLTDLKIVKPELELASEINITSTPGQIYDAALTLLPEIKSAEYLLLSSEKTLKVAQGGRSPKLSFQGSLATGYSGKYKDQSTAVFNGYQSTGLLTTSGEDVLQPSFDVPGILPFSKQIDDNLNQTIGFNLTVPIFNGLSVKTNISKAKIAKQKTEYDLTLTKNQVQKNVQQAYADASAALKKYKATKKSLEALEESFKYADKRFSVGDINAVEYNDAKNKLSKVQSDLLQAKYDFVFKQKILDFYQGKALVF